MSKQWDGYIGFAVMLFKTLEQATRAIELLHGRWIGDSRAFADYSRVPPPPERKSRNKDRMLNPQKYEEPTGPSEKELKKREKAAEAREKRRVMEEEMVSKYGSKATERTRMGMGDAGYRYALSRAQAAELAYRPRHTVTPDESGVLAGIGGARVGQATSAQDKLEGLTSAGAQRSGPEEVASGIRGDSTDKPSDELVAEAGERAQAVEEANDRIAAAKARRAGMAAEEADEADEVTDNPNEAEPRTRRPGQGGKSS